MPGRDSRPLAARGWLPRMGFQYHWTNTGFATFDDYLASLRSKRRNQAHRERRQLVEQGVVIEAFVGDDVAEALVPVVYRLYRATVDGNPWGQRYRLTPLPLLYGLHPSLLPRLLQ